ncbi:MAG: hypothetical protein K2X86_06025 [Cytophagaceae bacterium]|nr:hypothetical protein [Cytophagaceae bacterium]
MIAIISLNLYAQIPQDTIRNNSNHEHHKNEIGIASSAAYFKGNELSYSMHIHYIRNISGSKFGLGLSFERIFFTFKHNTAGVVIAYRPLEKLSLISSPGVTFEEDNLSNPVFTLHTEVAYEFEIGAFHIGPAFEFAFDPNDYHMGLGLHVGYGF